MEEYETYRIFPENKVGRITETEIARLAQSFADVAALAELSSCLIFLFLSRPNLGES